MESKHSAVELLALQMGNPHWTAKLVALKSRLQEQGIIDEAVTGAAPVEPQQASEKE